MGRQFSAGLFFYAYVYYNPYLDAKANSEIFIAPADDPFPLATSSSAAFCTIAP
jgi:hypothetical protein